MTLREYITAMSLLMIGGTINHFLGFLNPKSRLVYWYPHSFLFENVQDNVVIHTQTYTIQNLGRKACEQIEIIYKNRPDHFQMQPERCYSLGKTPNNEHVVQVDSLAPKEFFSIEILSYSQLPNLRAIRSKDGQAQQVQFLVQQAQPKWKSRLAIFLILMGVATTGYAAVKTGELIYYALP